MRRSIAERAVRFIASLQRQGVVPATVDPRYAATALTGMVDRFAYVWLVLEEDFDEEQVVDTLATLWYQAIGGVDGRPRPLTPGASASAGRSALGAMRLGLETDARPDDRPGRRVRRGCRGR